MPSPAIEALTHAAREWARSLNWQEPVAVDEPTAVLTVTGANTAEIVVTIKVRRDEPA